MPLSFPRSLPDTYNVTSCLMVPRFGVVTPRTRGGELLGVEIADPFWELRLTFAPSFSWDMAGLYTWFNSMEGGLYSFLCHDHSRPVPVNYRLAGLPATAAGGGAFDGSCAVDAVAAYSLTLSALPASFVFKAGDKVGLVEGGRYGLHEITTDATADGSGVVTVDVVPPVNTSQFSTSATAQVNRPVAEFVPKSIDGEPSVNAVPVTISGIQKL